jgi:hypothetical protein
VVFQTFHAVVVDESMHHGIGLLCFALRSMKNGYDDAELAD